MAHIKIHTAWRSTPCVRLKIGSIWFNLSTPERLAPPRMRKPLRWVVLVITCSTWEWRPSRPVTGWESWWKHWEFKKTKSRFTSATGWEVTVLWWFYTQFIHVYTVCAEFIDFSCFLRWASLVQKALGTCSRPAWRHGVWTFTRGRSSSLVWLLITFIGWISLCE